MEDKYEQIINCKSIINKKENKSEDGPLKTKKVTLQYEDPDKTYKITVTIEGTAALFPRFFDNLRYANQVNCKFYRGQKKMTDFLDSDKIVDRIDVNIQDDESEEETEEH